VVIVMAAVGLALLVCAVSVIAVVCCGCLWCCQCRCGDMFAITVARAPASAIPPFIRLLPSALAAASILVFTIHVFRVLLAMPRNESKQDETRESIREQDQTKGNDTTKTKQIEQTTNAEGDKKTQKNNQQMQDRQEEMEKPMITTKKKHYETS
jgi:membrane protein implicated in regulation of membrane protease activity